MQSIYIKFLTKEDRVRGFYKLATRAGISSLPGESRQASDRGSLAKNC